MTVRTTRRAGCVRLCRATTAEARDRRPLRHQHARAGRNGHDRDHGRRGRQSQQVLDLRRRQSADGAGIRHERAVGKAGRRTLRTIDPYVLGRRGGHHHGGRRARNERRRGRHAADIGVGVRPSGDRGHRAWRTLSGLLEHGPRQHHSRRQGEAGLGSGFSCDARHQRDDAGQDRADTPRARSTTHLSLPLPEAPQEMRANRRRDAEAAGHGYGQEKLRSV